MRLTFVITNAPPLVGGLEKVCLRLAQQFVQQGHQVRILGRFTQARHALADYFQETEKPGVIRCEGIEVEVLTLDARAKLLLSPVFKLIWRKITHPMARRLYIAALGPQLCRACTGSDLVHFFGNGPEMLGFAAEEAARQVGAKFVIEPALHKGQWGDKWFDALLYKRADVLLAHTRHEAGVLERMGIPATKIRTIVHGVDFCDSGDGMRFRNKHGISGPMVLFLGRKTKEKGVERLLKAWPMVAEKFPEATLVFAGPKSDALRQMANGEWRMAEEKAESGNAEKLKGGPTADDGEQSQEGSKNVPFSATMPRARVLNLDDLTEGDKQDALAACDLLCVPSEGESFGMVYFEAWAYGKPVVGLDLPVLWETIAANEAGLLAKDDPKNIATAICELLKAPFLSEKMGQRGMEIVKKHAWKSSAYSYIESYNI